MPRFLESPEPHEKKPLVNFWAVVNFTYQATRRNNECLHHFAATLAKDPVRLSPIPEPSSIFIYFSNKTAN
jgi:hypothetical protein